MNSDKFKEFCESHKEVLDRVVESSSKEKIGQRVSETRRAENNKHSRAFTQRNYAALIGIGNQGYGAKEGGTNGFNATQIAMIAAITGKTCDELILGKSATVLNSQEIEKRVDQLAGEKLREKDMLIKVLTDEITRLKGMS